MLESPVEMAPRRGVVMVLYPLARGLLRRRP